MLMLNGLILLFSLIASAITLIILFLTTPTEVGPFGAFILFLMIYIVMFGAMTFIVSLFSKIVGKRKGMSKKEYRYAAVLALGPVLLLVIRATGSFNIVISLLISAIIVSLCCLWVKKAY